MLSFATGPPLPTIVFSSTPFGSSFQDSPSGLSRKNGTNKSSRIRAPHNKSFGAILLCRNLQKTLELQQWQQDDFPMHPIERLIWDNWKFKLTLDPLPIRPCGPQPNVMSKWDPPLAGILKLNFDGASKGNLGEVGYGGILTDHKGNPMIIYYGSIGWDTNNSAELEGLW